MREFPRLKYGGAHLGDGEEAAPDDIFFHPISGGSAGILIWVALATLIVTFASRGTLAVSPWRKVWRGETPFAWNAVLITPGLNSADCRSGLCLIYPIPRLGTDKVKARCTKY